ncbi:MAG TPA: type II toxin-antitoxin system VapC family toxin [Pseudonocardiaceae bacterium]|nr:type II toxin-antitoxin system VapC family toxin [Pseudonocardiaceae bacterium]
MSTRLLYVATAAALAQARRMRRLTESQHATALRAFDQVWDAIDVIEVDDRIVRLAADMSFRFGLRGYDAVHCASAATVSDDELVVATGDRTLLDACPAAGLATIDVSGTG